MGDKNIHLSASLGIGKKPKDGMDGKDAINIVFSPAELVFDADENGNLKQAEKSAEIKVYRGTTELQYKTDWDNDAEIGDNCRAALLVNTTTNKPEVKISEIKSSMIDDVKVPATSGGANVSVIVDGVKYRAYLPFSVNVNTYANFLIRDNKKYISKYTEVSNKYDAVYTELNKKADLKTVESTIEQTAKNIKLEVLSKTSGRRNMLVNSAFRNQDSVFIHSLARIEKNTGVDGVNCIHSKDTYSGTGEGNYIGAFWDSTQRNGVVTNIPISKGKKYVISCWIRSDNKDLPFVIECFFMNIINQQNRGEDAVRKEYHVDNVNEWKRIDFVVDTTDTSEYASKVTPYLAVNFWSNTKNVPKAIGADEYPTCHAYICKPMMEEGDTYGGWTLSEDDYDYVGGNILDNTRSLEKSGNLETEDSEIINEGYEYAYAVARTNNTTSTYIDMLQWNMVGRINDGQDYMFSFLAKGTGVVSTYLRKDGTPSFFVESSNNKYDAVSPDGNVDFELTNEWKRYWVHYHLNTSSGHPLPENLLIRCYSGNDVYICQPKLEIGATMTEFTERKTDLVDKASLKKAGIEITTNQVKLYGDKVQVLTRIDGTPEYEEAGMFTNGKFNAKYIDAENIVVNGLQGKTIDAKNATISNLRVKNVLLSGSMRNPFTRVWDSFTNPYMDNIVMQNENSTYESVHNLPWNVEQSGRKLCIVGSLWDIEKPNTFWGPSIIEVPEEEQKYGCRFYENGIAKTKLEFSAEVLELMAYGNVSAKTDDNPKSKYIYGWIVLNRIDLMTNHQYGRQKKVLAYGKVTGTTGGASIQYKTFDGSKMSISRGDKGLNILHIPKWVYSESSLFVTLTNLSSFVSLGSIEATSDGFNINVLARGNNSFDEGSFNFEISNFDDFG